VFSDVPSLTVTLSKKLVFTCTFIVFPWREQRPTIQRITLIKYRAHNEILTFRLLEKIQGKWCEIGTLLGVPMNAIIGSHMTITEKCQEVVRVWLEMGSQEYPVEWESLIKVLRDAQMGKVADDLKNALDNQISPNV